MSTCVSRTEPRGEAKNKNGTGSREQLLRRPTTANWKAHQQAAIDENRLSIVLRAITVEDLDQLQSVVQDSVERTLLEHGASACCHPSGQGLAQYLNDALYRARLLGAGGLALAFSDLSPILSDSKTLSEKDSLVIRMLLSCAEAQSLHLFFPPSSLKVHLVGAPCPLASWLPPPSNEQLGAVIEYEKSDRSSEDLFREEHPEQPLVAAFTVGASELESTEPSAANLANSKSTEVARKASPANTQTSASSTPKLATLPESGNPEPKRCDTWANELEDMSGRKVHGAIERAFANSYMPLHNESLAGRASSTSQDALHRWGEDFAQSYSSAYDTMQRSSRRPQMVGDVSRLAARWAEQYRVPRCELLVINSLRYDLGQLLHLSLEERMEKTARCVEHSVLWAALPSNGHSQRLDASPAAPPSQTYDGSTVSTVPATLHRLNSLDDPLSGPGEASGPRLERLALELADQLVPWLAERKQNTMVVIFGDHGFTLEPHANGTAAAAVGGALPEQVLVPAYAWIVGAQKRNSKAAASPNKSRPSLPLN